MPLYTHERNYKDQVELVPIKVIVEGLNGAFVEETLVESCGVYTRERVIPLDEIYECDTGKENKLIEEIRQGLHGCWHVGDYVYLPSKRLFGFVTKVNRVMLSISNPEIKKTHKVSKSNVLLISRFEQHSE